MIEPLFYSDERPPAEPCPECDGEGMIPTQSGNRSPCNNEGCDAGFMWIDGSVPTVIPPCGRKSPVIAARQRMELPFCHPDDATMAQLRPNDTTNPDWESRADWSPRVYKAIRRA